MSDVLVDWRIGEAGGTVTFETSANQTTWTPVTSLAAPFALDTVELRFGTKSTVNLSGSPINLTFSTYN